MIPIPEAVKTKILAWLPHILNGYDYRMQETDNIAPDLVAPAVTYYFSSVGNPSPYSDRTSDNIIRTVRNADGTLDDVWGEFCVATLNVVLRSNDKGEMKAMWRSFLREVHRTRRNLLLRIDGVRFVEILNSEPLEPQRLPEGKNLHWAQVDLRFEYEQSGISEAEYIQKVHTDLDVNGSHILLEREVRNPELAVGISAIIV